MQAMFREGLRSRQASAQDPTAVQPGLEGLRNDAATILDWFRRAAIASLNTLHRHGDPVRLEKTITRLAQARRIYIMGLRRSMSAARYLSYLMMMRDIPNQIVGLEAGMEEDAVKAADTWDAAIIISFPPYARRTVELLHILEQRAVPVVSLTDNAASPVIPSSGLWLEVAETDFFGLRSSAATMVLIMTLATAIAKKRE